MPLDKNLYANNDVNIDDKIEVNNGAIVTDEVDSPMDVATDSTIPIDINICESNDTNADLNTGVRSIGEMKLSMDVATGGHKGMVNSKVQCKSSMETEKQKEARLRKNERQRIARKRKREEANSSKSNVAESQVSENGDFSQQLLGRSRTNSPALSELSIGSRGGRSRSQPLDDPIKEAARLLRNEKQRIYRQKKKQQMTDVIYCQSNDTSFEIGNVNLIENDKKEERRRKMADNCRTYRQKKKDAIDDSLMRISRSNSTASIDHDELPGTSRSFLPNTPDDCIDEIERRKKIAERKRRSRSGQKAKAEIVEISTPVLYDSHSEDEGIHIVKRKLFNGGDQDITPMNRLNLNSGSNNSNDRNKQMRRPIDRKRIKPRKFNNELDDVYNIESENMANLNEEHDEEMEQQRQECMRRATRLSNEVKRDILLESLSTRVTRTIDPALRDYRILLNAVPDELDLGDIMTCAYCDARTYTYNCCGKGNVRIPPPRDPPRYIKKLLTEATAAGKHFRKEIVSYNAQFAMASISCDRDRESKGEPFAKVNGMMHHMLAGSVPPKDRNPVFHQIYKYDVNEATKIRVNNVVTGDSVRPNIIRNIQMILEEENYLVKQYKTANDIMEDMIKQNKPLRNLYVVLRAPSEVGYHGSFHPGTLGLSHQEVQSFLYTMTEEDDGGPAKHGVYIVHRQFGGKLEVLGYWNPLRDPLGYPLLFPCGNSGYRRKDYELKKHYVVNTEEDEMNRILREESDPYPFEHCDDEMDMDKDGIDYERARKKYKEYRENNGEVVSESESEDEINEVDEEDFDENEESRDAGNIQEMNLIEDGERIDADMQIINIEVSDDEDEAHDPSREQHRFLQDSSDDSETDDIKENDDSIGNINIPDLHEVIETDEERKARWKKYEELMKNRILEEEGRRIRRNMKLKQFKKTCRSIREADLRKFFEPEELDRVIVDIEYMRRKERNRKDDIYEKAKFLFDLTRSQVDSIYSNDREMKRIEEDINEEISQIYYDPDHRSNEPKIVEYRRSLFPAIQDDNANEEIEHIDDPTQHEVNQKAKNAPVQNIGSRKYVSRREHALHQFQTRKDFHPYLSTLLLGQLYVIDVALRYIRQRNDTQRDHLIQIRGTNEQSLAFRRHSRAAERKGCKLGYVYQLPSHRIGSTKWYREEFENAMATVDYAGKPDLFITMTGNPDWNEIKKYKLRNSTWQSNPFHVNDVFHVKMQELLDDIINKEVLGPVVAWCYSIEFQKRGMPHMHLLVTLQDGYKLDTSEKIDKIISARIPPEPEIDDPDYEKKKRFRENVINMMVHTACIGNPGAYCNVRPSNASDRVHTRCTKNFPCNFNDATSTTDNGGKVDYYRPDDGIICTKKVNNKEVVADNRYVVPYNPFLLNKYGCHINVEAVSTVDVVKYIYKYIYKGFDKALAHFIEACDVDDGADGRPPPVEVHANIKGRTGTMAPKGLKGTKKQWADMDERINAEFRKHKIEAKDGERLTAYDEAIMTEVFRQMTASEAAWILQSYKLSGNSHTVIKLSVHEEGKMPVFFRHHEEESISKRMESGTLKSHFMAWFELNKNDENARKYTYDEIPLYYKWVKTNKKCQWEPYKNNMTKNRIIRVNPVSPRYLQCFALRLLAKKQRGPQSYEDLRTVDGKLYDTPIDAAKAMGLINSQDEYRACLQDAISFEMPHKLRCLFSTILAYGQVENPEDLWNEFKEELYDRRHANNPEKAQALALYHIAYILTGLGCTLEQFKLPEIDTQYIKNKRDIDEVMDGGFMPDPVDNQEVADKMEASLNYDQREVFKTIMRAVYGQGSGKHGNCFFLQGSGGCGKTFLYRALYHRLQAENPPVNVSMIATTGIAATLLINGSTAHRKFMLPLNSTSGSTSNMAADSKPAEEIRKTSVFIIDEATMASKFTFSAIDNLLRDIMNAPNKPFGGKIVLLGGDWKQLLPVVPGTSSNESVHYTLKGGNLWKDHFKVLTLSKNMRAEKDPGYAHLLENVGNGMVNGKRSSNVLLEPKCIVQSEKEIIDYIYKDMSVKPIELAKSCILASLNTETCAINDAVLDRLPGNFKIYTAIDKPKDGIGMQVPPEYFRNDMPTGMPPYELRLKKGAIVILLRNINVSRGLCNGTRLEIVEMRDAFLICKVLTTDFAGDIVWIPPIKMDPASKGKKCANYTRTQFPLRLSYAMTINKAQGQTFEKVGIVLKNNVFAHGQLYVALSRARQSDNVRVYSAASIEKNGKLCVVIKNKVEHAILEKINENNLFDPNFMEPEPVEVVFDDLPEAPVRGRITHNHATSEVLKKIVKNKDKKINYTQKNILDS